MSFSPACNAGLLALGHLHGVSTKRADGEPDDLVIARDLMRTCYELYRRTPTGLAPEIAHFEQRGGGADFPKQHAGDVGGGDFTIKPQARATHNPCFSRCCLDLAPDALSCACVVCPQRFSPSGKRVRTPTGMYAVDVAMSGVACGGVPAKECRKQCMQRLRVTGGGP
jgi:hypothetical protein